MSDMFPKNGRVIFHVDMNSFYASVELTRHPELKGKPLAIAGDPKSRHGVVVTSSYEARKYGVKTTMTVRQAKRVCPALIIRRPDFPLYRRASEAMFAILRRYTDDVQPVSIDEGYVDVTDCSTYGTPLQIADAIQKQIAKQLQLPCSIGIAPNKYLAKMASDMKKPLGITVLRKRDIRDRLWPLNVGQMHGVGAKTAEKLQKAGIYTIGELAQADTASLKQLLGLNGVTLNERANGIDDRLVDPEAAATFQSIGSSTTLPEDILGIERVTEVMTALSDAVEKRLDRKGVVAFNIQLVIRYDNRDLVTRSQSLHNPVGHSHDILQAALTLWHKHWDGRPVRLLGITGKQLVTREAAYRQLNLFSYEQETGDHDTDMREESSE